MTIEKQARIKILRMIENGTISAEEGHRQLRELMVPTLKADSFPGPDLIYLHGQWREKSLVSPTALHPPLSSTLLIFDDHPRLTDCLAERQNTTKIPLVRAEKGSSFSQVSEHLFRIRPNEPDDYQQLLKILQESHQLPETIFHSWSDKPFNNQAAELEGQLEIGLYSLFHLTRALMAIKAKSRIRLLFVYPFDQQNPQPQYAAAAGYVRTLRQETPRFLFSVVGIDPKTDCPPSEQKNTLAATLLRELQTDEPEVRYVGNQRLVKVMQEFTGNRLATDKDVFREKGIYLITGGAGGLGYIFAEYLASLVHARLLLCGRSELDKSRWADFDKLRELGAEVEYRRADVGKLQDVEALIDHARKRFGALNGILHSAGLTRDSFILRKKISDMATVITPKVTGTMHLDQASAGEDLDFFVLFSSTAGVTGNLGQCDYAFANSFMDNFAEYRHHLCQIGQRRGKTLSINWPLWASGGMGVDEQSQTRMKKTLGMVPLSTRKGNQALTDFLNQEYRQPMVIQGDPIQLRSIFCPAESAPSSPALETAAPLPAPEPGHPKKNRLREKTEFYLKKIIAEESKAPVAEIRSKDAFEVYGIDSLMILNMTGVLEKQFGELPKTLFFEMKNISDLADYLMENHGKVLMETVGWSADDLPFQQASETAGAKEPKSDTAPQDRDHVIRFAVPDITMPNQDQGIAIIGISGSYPGAVNLEEFWKNLLNGRDSISEIPAQRWNLRRYYDPDKKISGKSYSKWGGFLDKEVYHFDPLFFNISPKEAENMDPQERLFLQTVWHTLENATYTKSDLAGTKVGVYVGVMWGLYQLYGAEPEYPGFHPGAPHASIANRISYFFDFKGPSLAIDTMCSSSLTAIHLACDSLHKGESELAIAGGVNIASHPNKYLQLSQGRYLSSDGKCRSFGDGGDGYVPGEGVGAVLLKPLRLARNDNDRIHAIIRASSVNHGGKSTGYTVPNPTAQAEVILATIQRSGLDLKRINYIEAHGTGTALGDPIEFSGLSKAFAKSGLKKHSCPIGSVKSNIGHLESAAGIASLTKVILQLQHQTLVPSLHAETLNRNIDFSNSPFYIQRELAPWPRLLPADEPGSEPIPRLAGISSFGAGGANAHLLVEEYLSAESPHSQPDHSEQLIILSAKTEERLKICVTDLVRYLGRFDEDTPRADRPDLSAPTLAEIAYTLQVGREALEERLALVVSDMAQLRKNLETFSHGGNSPEKIFRGNTLGENHSIQHLATGHSARQLAHIALAAKDLEALAQLWVAGLAIDWRQLYPSATPARIDLPLYPFSQEQCWIPKAVSISPAGSAHAPTPRLHPLVGSNESTLSRQKFVTKLTGTEFFLTDHKIAGQEVMPGAAFLEMARAAASIAWEMPVCTITDMTWLAPLAVSACDAELHIQLFPQDERVACEILGIGEDDAFRLHARATLESGTCEAPPPPEMSQTLEAIKERCSRIWSQSECYQRFQELSLEYGRSFRTIAELRSGENEALAFLELPDGLQDEFLHYTVHPSLLDGALQGVLGTMKELNSLHIPYSVEKIEIFKPLSQTCHAHIVKEPNPAVAGRKKFHIRMLDRDGELLVRLSGFSLIPYSPVIAKRDTAITAPELSSGQTVEEKIRGKDRAESQTAVQHLKDQQLLEAVHAYLKELISRSAKLQSNRIKTKEPLESYGIDSVMIMKMTTELETHFAELPKTLFFEYQSVAELADYLIVNHRPQLLEIIDCTPSDHEVKAPAAATPPSAESPRLESPATHSAKAEKANPGGRFLSRLAQSVSSRAGSSQQEEIAIIGISGRYPQAENIEQFWNNLREGRNCIEEIPGDRWDHTQLYDPRKNIPGKSNSKWGGFIDHIDKFDPLFFNIPPSEAMWIDPQERLFLENVWCTMEDAGYTRARLARENEGRPASVGVFAGCMYQQYPFVAYGCGKAAMLSTSSYWSIANRVSYFFNFQGPSLALDSACSSSLYGVHLACESLRRGECQMAVAGGVNLSINPQKYLALSYKGIIGSSPESRSLGDGDGYIPGEGVGSVLLKPLSRAIEDRDRIYCVIKAGSVNHGGRSSGFTTPNPKAQTEVIVNAFQRAGIDPATVGYIEVAANGSAMGDPIELSSLTAAFNRFTQKRNFCAIGTVKSNIGHLEAASGISQLSKAVCQFRHGMLAPSINAEPVNPQIDLSHTPFYIQKRLEGWPRVTIDHNGTVKESPRRMAISSFGAGGTNVHLILEEHEQQLEPQDDSISGPQLIVLSAKTLERLRVLAGRLADFLERNASPLSPEVGEPHLIPVLRETIIRWVGDLLNLENCALDPAVNLGEYGMDQVDLAAMKARIEEKYDLLLEPAIFIEHSSIDQLSAYLCDHYREALLAVHGGETKPCPQKPENEEPLSLVAIAYTLHNGREAMNQRMAFVVEDHAQLLQGLRSYSTGEEKKERFFTGNTRNDAAIPESLLQGSAGRTFIDSLIRERDLKKLAQLWVAGMEIDWRPLYGPRPPLPLSLPTYPFERKRCWVPNRDADQRQPSLPKESGHSGRNALKVSPLYLASPDGSQAAFFQLGAQDLDFEHADEIRQMNGTRLCTEDFFQEHDRFLSRSDEQLSAEALSIMEESTDHPSREELSSKTQNFLAAIIGDILMIPAQEIDYSLSFSEYGIESFQTLHILKRLEHDFGSLPKSLLFEYINIEELSRYLLEHHAGRLKALVAPKSVGASTPEQHGKHTLGPTQTQPLIIRENRLPEEPELQELVSRLHRDYGRESVARARKDIAPFLFFGNRTDEGFFYFNHNKETVLVFSYCGIPEKRDRLVLELLSYCRKNNLQLNMISTDSIATAGQEDFTSTPFAAMQRINNLSAFTLEGKKMRRLRYQISKFTKTGQAKTLEYLCGASQETDAQIAAMIDRWSQQKTMVNPYVGKVKEEILNNTLSPGHRIFLTYLDEILQNVIIITKMDSDNGFLMDLEFYPPEMPLGGLEFGVANIIETLLGENCSLFSLGATWGVHLDPAPHADPLLTKVLADLRQQEIFTGEGNFQFKNKFRPDNTPIYLCRPQGTPADNVMDVILMLAEPATMETETEPTSESPPPHNRTAVPLAPKKEKTTATDRREILQEAGFNIMALPTRHIEFDLLTDSWSELDLPGINNRMAALHDQDRSSADLVQALQAIFPFPYIQPVSSGRMAESFFCQSIRAKKGTVPQNLLFPTFIFHQINNGFQPRELPVAEAFRLDADFLFKGNLDLTRLKELVDSPEIPLAMVCVELNNNGAGGYPTALANLRSVKELISHRDLPLVIDATRIIENARFIAAREPEYNGRDTEDIIAEICALADHLTASLTKDFCLNTGGLFATRDPQLFEAVQGMAGANGNGLNAATRRAMAFGLQERHWMESIVELRMNQVERIWQSLQKESLPVVRPSAGHCLVIDVKQIKEFAGQPQAPASFLAWLYWQTGIRGGIHNSGMSQKGPLSDLVRLAIPVGLEDEQVDEIIHRLTTLFRTKRDIPTLESVSRSRQPFSSRGSSYRLKDPEIGRSAPHFPKTERTNHSKKQPQSATPKGGRETVSTRGAEKSSPQEVMTSDIAVIGMDGKFPMAANIRELWENLKAGRDCITEIPEERWPKDILENRHDNRCRWGGFIDGVDCFDTDFFRIPPNAAAAMDPQQRLFLQTAWRAIEDAGYSLQALLKSTERKVGVFVGATWNDYGLLAAQNADFTPDVHIASIANRVSYHLGLQGPSLAVDTHCSSSSTALHLACQSIVNKACPVAIAGGVNLSLHPSKYCQMNIFLSTEGKCRSFGKGGDGYVPSEGVAAVVLKDLQAAINDQDHIYGVIKASALNHDGSSNGYMTPNPLAQSQIIKTTLELAGIEPATITCVEAQGTGTELGDTIELDALSKAFQHEGQQKQYCSLGSIKSNIGHLEAAGGVAQLIKILLQMRYKTLVPSLHSRTLNPHIDFGRSPFFVQQDLAHWPANSGGQDMTGTKVPRRAAINSYGAGGANAHLVIEEYEMPLRPAPDEPAKESQLIVLSARDGKRLRQYAAAMAGFLEQACSEGEQTDLPGGEPGFTLAAMAYTLKTGRQEMQARLAMKVTSPAELKEKLDRFSRGEENIPGVTWAMLGKKSAPNNLSSREEIETLLKAKNKDYEIIADKWLNGEKIEWALEYQKKRPHRIPLPTYPFAESRYWVPERAEKCFPTADSLQILASPAMQQNPLEQYQGLPHPQRYDFLKSYLTESFARLSGHTASKLESDPSLRDLGLDSLMLLEFKNRLDIEMGLSIPIEKSVINSTIPELAEMLHQKLMVSGVLISGEDQSTAVSGMEILAL